MKKFGFTLAEILVTVGIIGVIAALTIPTLVTSNKKQVSEAAVKVAVNNLETALKTYITKNNYPSLFAIPTIPAAGLNSSIADASPFMTSFSDVIQIVNYNADVPNGYVIYDGITYNEGETPEWSNTVSFVSKNGSLYLINLAKSDPNAKNERDVYKDGYSLYKKAGYVYIDVNGTNPPNRLNLDVFPYIIGFDGTLYSANSADVVNYNKEPDDPEESETPSE